MLRCRTGRGNLRTGRRNGPDSIPDMEEVDVDSAPDLQEKYGAEVPVLFINGRKAFKVRVTVSELRKRLRR